jgi:Sugar kinases, ribokinase family
MKRAVAVGFSCVDVYENLNKWYPTGNGIDWGIHLARLGIPMAVVSAVGDDVYGQEMKKRLTEEGIEVSHLEIKKGRTCQMLMALKNGVDRVHMQEISGVMEDYHITQDQYEYAAGFDYLHTDLFGGVLEHLRGWHEQGVKIVMDFSVFTKEPEYHCMDIFPNVDYVFFSTDEEDEEALKAWMKEIKAQGPAVVTATMGENGSISYDGDKFYCMGIHKADVVNTVGAGDSYIAGFTYGLMTDSTIPACMEKGAQISAEVVARFEPY